MFEGKPAVLTVPGSGIDNAGGGISPPVQLKTPIEMTEKTLPSLSLALSACSMSCVYHCPVCPFRFIRSLLSAFNHW